VSAWASRGIPIKIAFEGIDRYFERYYRSGPRRRPVKIDFCDADVLDVFDEWRRATGVQVTTTAGGSTAESVPRPSSGSSLPSHLERIVMRLTAARASGALGESFDALIDRAAADLDLARAKSGGLRGAARAALVERLSTLDAELLSEARAMLDEEALRAMRREAEDELAPFRSAMKDEAYNRARDAAVDRLVRARFGLPVIGYQS
jgi:hypothetical protein